MSEVSSTTSAKVGIVIVDHGSRRDESNQLLMDVAAQLRNDSDWSIVEPAHMEIAEPTIAQAFDRCADQGAELVIVHPFFVGPGRHCSEDIPSQVEQAASGLAMAYRITPPLGPDALLIEIVKQRIDAVRRT